MDLSRLSDSQLFNHHGRTRKDGRTDRLPDPSKGDNPLLVSQDAVDSAVPGRAPAPMPAQPRAPQQSHGASQQEPLLHGLLDDAPQQPKDWRAAMYDQHTSALKDAVDKTNDTWAKEMDRRSDAAEAERERLHKLDLARMEQESLARHDATMLQQDQERRAFLGNLLAGSGMVPHTVRFGG